MRNLFVAIIVAALLISCKDDNNSNAISTSELRGNAIGTTYSIKYFSDQEVQLQEGIDSLIQVFNQSMSTWVPNSQINQINQGKDSVAVGEEFKLVFDYAQEIYRKTDGYFDPTVGNLVNAYGFGSMGEQDVMPSMTTIDSLKQYVGFYKMDMIPAIDQGTYYVLSSHDGIYLEFNAIAKGTLVDYMAGLLRENGINNYLVEVGGEVIASGVNLKKQKPWRVGIADPTQQQKGLDYIATIELQNKAMAGSGNYRKFKIDKESGRKFVHTVNPITGTAVPTTVVGVNVIADNCTLADGYATAFMAMPIEKSRKMMGTLKDIDVLIMVMDDDGQVSYITTPGFEQLMKT